MADIASIGNALKTKYIGPLRENLYTNHILLYGSRMRGEDTPMPQGSKPFRGIVAMSEGIDYVGEKFVMSLHTSRNRGVGPRAENGKLPKYGAQGYKRLEDTLRYWYGQFRLTGPMIKAARKNEGSFIRAMSSEMEGLSLDLKRAVSIACYQTKDTNGTAPLATVALGVASATQSVDSTVWFEIGDFVDIYDVTGTTKRNATVSLTVDAITPGTPSITLSASITSTTGDIIIRSSSDSTGAAGASTLNNDLLGSSNGLGNIVTDVGTLHNINPATDVFWKSSIVSAGGATVGDQKLRELTDDIGRKSGADAKLLFIWSRGIRNRYVDQLIQFKQFNDSRSVVLQGGFEAITFDGNAAVVDDHLKPGQVLALNTDALFWAEMSDWEWLDLGGGVLQWDNGFDAWIGTLCKYMNLGTFARNRHGRLTNCADETR